MSGDCIVSRHQVELFNSLGLHLRAAPQFAQVALRFQSEILVHYNGSQSNGKSILDLTALGAVEGARLGLEARGPDADAAVRALASLVAAQFYDEETG
jgi:phosphocarrier protein